MTNETRETKRSGPPPKDVGAWLQSRPPLDALRAAFPSEWESVRDEIAALVTSKDTDALKAYAAKAKQPNVGRKRRGASRGTEASALVAEARRQMKVAVLRDVSLSLATGVTDETVRFNLWNGWVIQKLLFARDLERKPVSLRAFKLLWPRLSQRRLLMPLVQPKGIYCFYSKPLIDELAKRIGDRSCLEIAAGDGTLSRFLQDAGVSVTATDDHSWGHAVRYASTVLRQDARTALLTHAPKVVISSWPPAGNRFERDVFRTRSVELYIVIGSRHEHSAGNWDAYRDQVGFHFELDERLSALTLPPELDPAVYVFRRKTAATEQPGPSGAS